MSGRSPLRGDWDAKVDPRACLLPPPLAAGATEEWLSEDTEEMTLFEAWLADWLADLRKPINSDPPPKSSSSPPSSIRK